MASRRIELVISPDEDGLRTGEILRLRGFSARRTAKIKRTENGLTVNGVSVGTGNILRSGDVLSVYMPEEGKPPRCSPQLMGLAPIRYEDDDVIVFAKPVNMPVHTSQGHRDDALENLFAAVCPVRHFVPYTGWTRIPRGWFPWLKMPTPHGFCRITLIRYILRLWRVFSVGTALLMHLSVGRTARSFVDVFVPTGSMQGLSILL